MSGTLSPTGTCLLFDPKVISRSGIWPSVPIAMAARNHPGRPSRLVFNPATDTRAPCPHLAWVDGRYSQWDHPERSGPTG